MVERFFAEITRKRIRRGVFKSVAELRTAIMEYLENHNADPKPFVWTKSASQILEKKSPKRNKRWSHNTRKLLSRPFRHWSWHCRLWWQSVNYAGRCRAGARDLGDDVDWLLWRGFHGLSPSQSECSNSHGLTPVIRSA